MSGHRILLAAAMFSGMVAIGCDDSSSTPSGNPAPTPQASDAAADATKSKAEDAKDATKDIAGDAKDTLKQQAQTASDGLKKGADNAAEAVAANPAAADASAKIQQTLDYIKQHKLDLAESTLKQVEANKASLPAAVAAQVDNARKMLDTAKMAAATSQPGLPALPAAK